MKIIIFEEQYIVGFANSIKEFIEVNSKKSFPYVYPEDKLTSLTLTPDVFAITRIESRSNFRDYPRLASKE